MPLNYILFSFFSSYLHKNKVTSNSHVDCWHLTLLGATSCATHLSDKNLSLVLIFTLDVCSLKLWGAVRKSGKRQEETIECVGAKCPTTHSSHLWKAFLPALIWNTLKICYTAVSGESSEHFKLGVNARCMWCLSRAPLTCGWTVSANWLKSG